jgi:hypothetical protein
MPLKFKYNTKDQIPAEHQAFYTERDGAWLLDADGVIEKSRFDDFRNQNATLKQQLDDVQKRFEGLDPDHVRTQLEEKRKLEEAQAIKTGEFDKILESRTKALKAEFDKQLSTVTTERDTLNSKLTDIQINQGVIVAGTKRGLRSSAIPDITARAKNTFKLVNGVPRAFEPDGSTVRLGANAEPMTIDQWIESQLAEAPHLFEPNAGSGATGSSDSASHAGSDNPWRRESWNLTKQGELVRKDPARARALQAAAK